MKVKFCLLLSLVMANYVYAQTVTDFRLADYKYRTTGFRAGVINLNGFARLNESGVKNSTGIFDGDSKGFDLNASSGFLKTYSLDNRQQEIVFSPRVRLSGSTSTVQGERLPTRNYAGNVDYKRTERFYKKNYFTEFTGLVFLGGDHHLSKRVGDPKEKRTALNTSIAVGAGIGKGRMEFVEDAQMALFILEDLKDNNLLQGDKVDAETAYRFAQEITDIRNRRIQDFRRRRMYELARIDSFLRAANIVQVSDIRLFNIINDNWAFAVQSSNRQNLPTISERQQEVFISQGRRYSGFVRYARVTVGHTYQMSKNRLESSSTDDRKSSPNVMLSVGVEKSQPLSLKWQRNWHANINTTYIRDNMKGNSITTKNNYLAHFIDAGIDWGYFPNTRTSVGFGGATSLFYNKDNKFSAVIAAVGTADYFLNYFTRITAEVTLTAVPVARTGVPKPASAEFRIIYTHVLY